MIELQQGILNRIKRALGNLNKPESCNRIYDDMAISAETLATHLTYLAKLGLIKESFSPHSGIPKYSLK